MIDRDYLDQAYIGALIINYRISRYAPALAELKDEVDLYHYSGDSMPESGRDGVHPG